MDLLANISGIEYTPFLCPTANASDNQHSAYDYV